MARIETYQNGALVSLLTNGTQQGEPPAGAYDGAGNRQRGLTASEAALLVAEDTAATVATNLTTLQGRAQAALATNDTFLALASPTNAQVSTQVKALTRECSALIRMALNLLDTTSGT